MSMRVVGKAGSSDQSVAAAAVEATARQARLDADADLRRHQQQARHEARGRARRLISTARPSPRSTHSRYDAAARVLREWYLAVHEAALANSLGQASDVPDAAAVELTAAQVGRIRTGHDPQGPLRATALIWRVARADADADALAMLRAVRTGVAGQASGYVDRLLHHPTDGLRGDLRSAILRHWYQRCYLQAVDADLGLLGPLGVVSQAEAHEVAASITEGRARRLIGAYGVPLLTAHGTRMTETDRKLAAGETGVVAPAARPTKALRPRALRPNRPLREHVVRGWARASTATRTAWAQAAGVPHAADRPRWADIPADVQSPLIARWLHDHRGSLSEPTCESAADEPPIEYPPFAGARHRLRGPSEQAAARMFAHRPHVRP